MMKWWGPKHFTAPVCTIDFKVGGKYINCMQTPDGQKLWSTGTYKEIIPEEKIVCTDSFSDEQGNIVPASTYGMGDTLPLEFLVTVEFEEYEQGKTKMTLTHAGFEEGEMADSASQGWNQSFDKMVDMFAKSLI
jgi:uncharacterized protein YndB with AHSA1/START domain